MLGSSLPVHLSLDQKKKQSSVTQFCLGRFHIMSPSCKCFYFAGVLSDRGDYS